jgi:CBS domain-containing protein
VTAPASATHSPSQALIGHLVAELRQFAPFAQMAAEDVETFVRAARQTYHAPGEVLLSPESGPVRRLLLLRRGAVVGRRRGAAGAAGSFQLDAGELFPVGAALAARPVTSVYEALDDCFCLEVDAAVAQSLAARNAVWADFLNRRVLQLLDLSKQALQAAQASSALAEHSLEAPLGTLPRKPPVACGPGTPLRDALLLMHERRVGSVMVLGDDGAALGILTRHDVLERVALARPPEDTPIERLMSRPVHTLDLSATAQDAALLMSRHGVRHVPLTEGGRVVGIVSERDLFALQRRSLNQVGGRVRHAADRQALIDAAAEIRRFARLLLAQGLSARALTQLVSHLNDLLGERIVTLAAASHGLDLQRACWLVFGSEGRGEQTIATDQDNGLVFAAGDTPEAVEAERARWLALGREVNETLDACGIPLCKGGIMAGNPRCCLSSDEWVARFAHWMEHGAPEDLLAASIFFDFRPLAGNAALVEPMRAAVTRSAPRLPRFMKQMAENALRTRPPIGWAGGIEAERDGAHQWIDLKLQGTTLFVDAARIYALAHGCAATSTRERFEAAGPAIGASAVEVQSWIGAFEFLQMLRLRTQVGGATGDDASPPAQANRLDVASLGAIDRRILKESLRMARELQQRLELDYRR